MKINNLDKIIEDYLIRNENKLKINSNDIINGDVFIALQGRNIHGNKYINDALDNGAKYVITDKKEDSFINEKNISEAWGKTIKSAEQKSSEIAYKIVS